MIRSLVLPLIFYDPTEAVVTADSVQEFHNLNENQKLVLQSCVCQEFFNTDSNRYCSEYSDRSYPKNLFNKIDLDSDGKLKFNELALWVGYFIQNTTDADIHDSFLSHDHNKNGLIDLDELPKSIITNRLHEPSLRISNSSLIEEEYAAVVFGDEQKFPHLEEIFCKEEKERQVNAIIKSGQDAASRILELSETLTCKTSEYGKLSQEAKLFNAVDVAGFG